ncbi:Arginine exporter protein ArgO [Candidatus Terasakiella magnetica]|uniref:Arginine exporter protein ArgO n=1 Tax=Candidatus Terasakiella magnetica TaxID=1867952 RepID=A0A1C3RCM9_9PROT|nr:LysE/ArgO family amino acid transporter [Candidatus Terasakiella magnetica]SCA55037.1 Arginine exporter protein ArgO [Candidatus Terasakiella magnetica]
MISAVLTGFGVGGGLIIAIGAQNAFLLGQGLRRQHHIMVALICAFSDALLISIGVAGLGGLISSNPFWTELMAWGGAAFLGWYGLKSFKSLFSNHHLEKEKSHGKSRKEILLYTLAVTFLNPHVYIDTIVLVGGIAAQYEFEPRLYFALGAISASLCWFSFLAFAASWASPYLSRPITWKVIDGLTGSVMWLIAFSLIKEQL